MNAAMRARRSWLLSCGVALVVLGGATCGGGPSGPSCFNWFGSCGTQEVDPPPSCSQYSWVISAVGCKRDCGTHIGDPASVLDLSSSPPALQLGVGQDIYLQLWPINVVPSGCSGPSVTNGGPYVSSNPAVAMIETPEGLPTLRAVGEGEAMIEATMPTPAGLMRAQLAYCRAGPFTNCGPAPVPLVVRVVR
jgi:hypothetical protein